MDTPPPLAVSLDLDPHPEGGWYRRTFTAPTSVETGNGRRPTATAILYLLDTTSAWHRVRSAELWMWHAGSPIELTTGGDGVRPGSPTPVRLDGGNPQHAVPADHWQSARLLGPEPALVTCVVTPGFDFADFTLA